MLLFYLSYVAVLVAFAFVTLSLASGLLYISELIEEHSRLSKTIGQRGVYAILALHVVFYFTESLPFTHTAFSFFCHLVYLQNFSSTWPLISLSSPSFIASCVLVVSDHFLWFFYFARLSAEARHAARRPYGAPLRMLRAPTFVEIATFFGVCVWLVPLFLFLSLSANDNSLPVQSTNSTNVQQPKSRASLFRSLVSVFRPDRDRTEGLIAPRSPSSPTFYNGPFTSTPSPPRNSLSPEGVPTPPRRSSSPLGLGLRRTSTGQS